MPRRKFVPCVDSLEDRICLDGTFELPPLDLNPIPASTPGIAIEPSNDLPMGPAFEYPIPFTIAMPVTNPTNPYDSGEYIPPAINTALNPDGTVDILAPLPTPISVLPINPATEIPPVPTIDELLPPDVTIILGGPDW